MEMRVQQAPPHRPLLRREGRRENFCGLTGAVYAVTTDGAQQCCAVFRVARFLRAVKPARLLRPPFVYIEALLSYNKLTESNGTHASCSPSVG